MLHKWAEVYVNVYGFSVIPLKGKKPVIEWKEYQQRKPTIEELQEWFQENKFNIGIITGSISGIVVVDFDSEEAYQQFKDIQSPLVKTGKGYHMYFKYQDGVRNFQKREDLQEIDLRAEGGYVVAPPSMHPETKTFYEWINLPEKDNYPELPQIFFEPPKQKSDLTNLYKGVPKGERNVSLTKVIGSAVSDGLSYEECLTLALSVNEKNVPPLPEKEVETIVKSIYEKHRKIDILPPTFEIAEIPFGYELFYPPLKLYFKVKNIHHEKDGLKCYLEILCEDERAKAKDIYSANFNFYSTRSSSELTKILSANIPSLPNPTQLIESFKKEFKNAYFKIPIAKIQGRKIDYSSNFLFMPFILKDSINMIYGLGATGKSTFACYIAVMLEKRGYNVLYLDYENPTPANIEDIIARINPTARNIFIKNCKGKLTNEIEQIYEIVRKENIHVVIVDSVVKSILDDVFRPEAVSQYTSALFQVSVTWLLISHVAKTTPDDPYGSVFFFNDARNIWFAKKIQDHENNIIQLIHKKSNYTKIFPSMIYEIKYDNDRIFVGQKSMEDYITISEMILLSLNEEPKTFAQLKKSLPSLSAKVLKTYLQRLRKKNKIKIENATWSVIEEEDLPTE